jgi:hypothetical protein
LSFWPVKASTPLGLLRINLGLAEICQGLVGMRSTLAAGADLTFVSRRHLVLVRASLLFEFFM